MPYRLLNKRSIAIAIALLLIALAYCYRLDRPFLWGDEADTGIFSRNILSYGYPAAFDGRNIPLHDECSQLSKSLVSAKIPWLPYYLGALSITLFGNTPAGLRLLFSIIGILAFFPLLGVLRKRMPWAVILTTLLLLSPQIVLFSRSARYYSLLVLLYSFLVWHLCHTFSHKKIRLLTAVIALILFFHTHPVAAACTALSLLLFSGINNRENFGEYLAASCIGFLSWLIWYLLLGPTFALPPPLLRIMTADFSAWLNHFFIALKVSIMDMDSINSIPLLAWTVVLLAGMARGRTGIRKLVQEPVSQFVFISAIIHIIIIAACFGYETTSQFSLLRYMPHIALWAIIPLLTATRKLITHDRIFLIAVGGILITNLCTLSFWTTPAARTIPFSWWVPVYGETVNPREDGWHGVIKTLKHGNSDQPEKEGTILVFPAWTQETAIFYLGDTHLIPPHISNSVSECARAVKQITGEETTKRFEKRPDWILDFLGQIKNLPGYRKREIPCFRDRPDDGARPELTRHTFHGENKQSCVIGVYQLN